MAVRKFLARALLPMSGAGKPWQLFLHQSREETRSNGQCSVAEIVMRVIDGAAADGAGGGRRLSLRQRKARQQAGGIHTHPGILQPPINFARHYGAEQGLLQGAASGITVETRHLPAQRIIGAHGAYFSSHGIRN
jgi:hypothetical protein